MNAPRPDAETLALYALGLLDPEQRAAVEAALAADPALTSEHAEIARHLALYEKFPAPPEPPAFARVAAAAGVERRGWARWVPAAAAVVLAGTVAAVLALREEAAPPATFAVLVGVTDPNLEVGEVVRAKATAEFRVPRVRVVMEEGAAVRLLSAEAVRLEAGRAYFEVEPGPFAVETAHGKVEVLGTKFEVDVRSGLAVTVDEGRVRAASVEVGPRERLQGGKVAPAGEVAGAFFRRPILRVEAPKSGEPGAAIHVSLVLENPGHVRIEVPGPKTVATAALLSFAGPGGQVETRGLDFAQALSGGFDPLRPVVLGPRERRVVVFRVQVPSSAGSWRLSALYRPQGEAAVASEPVSLEVR